MNTCPKCKNGKMPIHLVNENKDIEIDCIYCDGVGEVSDEKLSHINAQDKFMEEETCKCDDYSFGSYPEDGQCSCGVYKHHVHCGTCGKISQFG